MKAALSAVAVPSFNSSSVKTLTVSCVFLLLLGSLAAARTIRVPADYPTVQGAIDASARGDEIIVSPGTYGENINFGGRNIILRSTDPTSPAIATDATGTAVSRPIGGDRRSSAVDFFAL